MVMSEENPASPPAEAAANANANGAGPGDGGSDGGPTPVADASAAANEGDVEMQDAPGAAPVDSSAISSLAAAAASASGGGGGGEEQAPRRTRSSSFDVREQDETAAHADASAPAPAPAEEQSAPAKKPVPEATRVSARVSNKGADRDASAENAMSSLLDAAEIRTTTVTGPTGMSFLDALTEEERRTRLRHVPGAEGFKVLHRSEVRRDMALARSIITGPGGTSGVIASSKASTAKGGRRGSNIDDDALPGSRPEGMDVDDDEGGVSDMSEGEVQSDSGSRRSGRDVVPTGPSPAFVPPVDTDPSPGSLPVADASEPASEKQKGAPVYPHIIESTVAFDPPRLPHSDAKSKKNRFSRWQAHPKEIEKDLESYRKTVADTRDHLHGNEREAERIEVVGGHLRSHFFAHLRCLRDEGLVLERELGAVQAKCVEKAELTKTRSTDADGGIGAKAMNDVLTVLKAKAGGSNTGATPFSGKPWCSTGIGGLPVVSDDDGSTGGDTPPLASGWLVPGDKVETPRGEAVVVRVDAAKVVEVPDESEKEDEQPKKSEQAEEEEESIPKKAESANDSAKASGGEENVATKSHGFGVSPATDEGDAKKDSDASDKPSDPEKVDSSAEGAGTDGRKAEGDTSEPAAVKSDEPDNAKKDEESGKSGGKPAAPAKKVQLKLVPAKVTVSFGENSATDEFELTEITLLEDPSNYSDEQLIERWKLMVATAKEVGVCADIGAMENLTNVKSSLRESSLASSGGDAAMEVEDSAAQQQQQTSEDSKAKLEEYGLGYADLTKTKMSTNKVLPFASSMLLSPGLRGTSLATIPFEKLEEYLDPMLYNGSGVLGRHNNPGVPADVKQWEDVRYEVVTLKGRANQLRNELHRQRRIRMLNERTRHVLDERAERVEGLLAETKSDLITLKEQLDRELCELGIDQDHAADILADYIKERDIAMASEEFPSAPKRRPKAEPKPAPAPRSSRRSRASQGSDDNEDAVSMKGDAAGDDDSSSKRKRNRSDESVDSGGPKPKRGGFRRQ